MPKPMLHEPWHRKIFRASMLDEFRAYQSGLQWDESDYTAEDYIRRLTVFEPSAKMEAGTAVHKLIEDAGYGALPVTSTVNGWEITFDLEADMRLPPYREVSLYREHRGIPLFGRCDALDATRVHDIKTTSSIDPERYLESYQWRAYLWMSGRRSFVYDIFRVIVAEDRREITVKEYVPIPVEAYPAMDADVEGMLVEFDACVRSLGLIDILAKEEARKAAIAEGNKG